MSRDILTPDERSYVNRLEQWYDDAHVGHVSLEMVHRLTEAFARVTPKPGKPSLAQLLYEAEGLYEKRWDAMNAGERSQYERMADAAREAL